MKNIASKSNLALAYIPNPKPLDSHKMKCTI